MADSSPASPLQPPASSLKLSKLTPQQAKYVEKIEVALEKGNLTIVVGAGVSVSAIQASKRMSKDDLLRVRESMLWTGVLQHGLDYLEEEEISLNAADKSELDAYKHKLASSSGSSTDILRAASFLKSKLADSGKLDNWFDLEFEGIYEKCINRDANPILDAMRELYKSGARIITTNYDDLLDKHIGGNTIVSDGTPALKRFFRKENTGICHVHGIWWHSKGAVLDNMDYQRTLQDDALQQDLKNSMSSAEVLLFIGTGAGLDDPNFGHLLSWAAEQNDGLAQRHCVLARHGQSIDTTSNRLNVIRYGYEFEDLPVFLMEIAQKFHPQLKAHWMVPFELNENFVGREAQLKEVIERLVPGEHDKACQRVAIAGLGGIGKTQIALKTALQVREKYPECSVFWVSAVSSATFEAAYRGIGQELQVAGIDDDDADVKSLVAAYLRQESAGRWLLIVDNADDLEAFYTGRKESDGHKESDRSLALANYLPSGRHGSILCTTRNHRVAAKFAGVNVVSIKEMSKSESFELLRKSLIDKTLVTQDGTSELLKLLTYLPLAIKQAAAFINQEQISIGDYLELCRSSDQDFIQVLSEHFEDEGRIQKSIALTWLISFHQIQQSDTLAAKYLYFISCIANQAIPHSLLPTYSNLEEIKAIGTLKAYAFITSRGKAKLYDIHRLVQLSVRNWLQAKGELTRWSCETLKQVARIFPFFAHEKRDKCALYLPHAQCILGFSDFSEDMSDSRAALAHNIGEYFLQTGKYLKAMEMYEQAFELRKTTLGDTHLSTLDSMSNLAVIYGQLGKYIKAEALQQKTLELTKKTLGDTHPSTLNSMNNLAIIYVQQGKYIEAEALQQQTLELRKTTLGDTHPSTLDNMNNLARTYRLQDKYAEAEALERLVRNMHRE